MEDTEEPPSPETMLAFRSRPGGDTTNGDSAAGSTPHLATHDITIRYHSTHIYIWRGFGTVTEVSSVPCITVYTAYSVGLYFMVNYSCQDGVHNIEVAGEVGKYHFLSIDDLNNLYSCILMWMAFLTFVFRSLVGAGLAHFNLTSTQVRATQSPLNEIMLQCHSHARLQVEHTLRTIQRFCGAFPFVMHMPAVMGGNARNLDHI
eukprot:jgi/Tetstr1/439168/TSEL_027619.t1